MLSLFADDMILYIENPKDSTQRGQGPPLSASGSKTAGLTAVPGFEAIDPPALPSRLSWGQ